MKLKKFILICLSALSIFCLTGCWDMLDIDNRFFVGNIGLDKAEEADKIEVTFTFPLVRKIAGGEGGSQGSGSSNIARVSTVADSLHQAIHHIAIRVSRQLFFEHTRVILLGEDLAREGFDWLINFISRNPDINRRGRILVVEGKAKDALAIKNDFETLLALYITDIFQNWTISSRFVEISIDDFMNQIYTTDGDALLPRLSVGKTDVSIGGAAVIKDYKLVGWLSEEETLGINFVMGKVRGGDLTFDEPGQHIPISFGIGKARSRIELLEAGPYPKFKIIEKVELNLTETPLEMKVDSNEKLKSLQKRVEEEVNSIILRAVNKLQKEYGVDLVGFGEYLYRHKPEIWKNYKDNWDDIFPNAEVVVETEVTIRSIGVSM